jgi:hypothetical protein
VSKTLGCISLFLVVVLPLPADEPSNPWKAFSDGMPIHFAADLADYRTDLSLTLATYDFVSPFGTNGMLWNMPETLSFAMDSSRLLHSLVGAAVLAGMPETRWGLIGGICTLMGVNFIDFYLPGGPGWLHEEWHRAVLAHRGISAQDDMVFFPFLRGIVSVSHVADEQLAWLKQAYPADSVRLAEAGYEADISFAFALKRRAFFDRKRFDLDRHLAYLESFSAVAYLVLRVF